MALVVSATMVFTDATASLAPLSFCTSCLVASLRALVRLDQREEPAEQLPTQHALYSGRTLRLHVGDDVVEEVDVNDHSRRALVEAPP